MFLLSLPLLFLVPCSAFQQGNRSWPGAFSTNLFSVLNQADAFQPTHNEQISSGAAACSEPGRRSFFHATTAAMLSVAAATSLSTPPAQAVGPIKVSMKATSYSAQPCPPSKPIPGQQAMKGMRGLCVTVNADLLESPPKDLEKVGVYGFVLDGASGDSVLANNPDLNTDAGQFAMIESIKASDKKIQFEFIAAVPKDRDLSSFANGIGPLDFESLRVISYPGGQQFGAINPVRDSKLSCLPCVCYCMYTHLSLHAVKYSAK
jgi:hypothetical protein